ncbi:MAG TPA: MarR family transcriptional regulator [Solirubrobacterales bacterium]|jgi:DNA-binding MarR family transcriptional regulator
MTTQAPPVTGTMNLLTRLSRVIYRSAGPELLGVKLKEFVTLLYLREMTKATQKKLAKTLMLDPNNTVILLNALEENGLVERTRDPQDRRRHLVAITPKGVKALEKAERELETVEDDVLGNLDASERSELHDLLAKAFEDHSLV